MSTQNPLVSSTHHVSGLPRTELVHLHERFTHHCAVVSGWVGLARPGRAGLELFALALSGDDLTHLVGQGRAAAIALTEVRLGPIDDPKPGVPEFLLRQCFRVARFHALQRMADFLLETAERLGAANQAPSWSCPLPLTQAQIGELLGLSTVHTNRVLKHLDRLGLAMVECHKLSILDPVGLGRLVRRNGDIVFDKPSTIARGSQ